VLEVKNLSKNFGGVVAVSKYNLVLEDNEILGLIGPNGAGKTTVFNLLSGNIKPSSGDIIFDNHNITNYTSDQTAKIGLARTFQNIKLFAELSVLDNIKVGFHMRMGASFFSTILNTSKYRKYEEEISKKSIELAHLLGIESLLYESTKELSYGDQRKMEIARALATQPKILLLDEPAAGMNPQETNSLMETIKKIHKDFKISILIVEHDIKFIMNLCKRIQVLDQGSLLAEGAPDEIKNSKKVIEAYLGTPKKAN